VINRRNFDQSMEDFPQVRSQRRRM
jgi:hypothetical protein